MDMSTELEKTPDTPAESQPERFAGGELPDLAKTLQETMTEFTENIGPYALAGVGQLLVVVPLVLVMVIVLYLLMFGGAIAMVVGLVGLMVVLPEDLAVLAMVLGELGGFVALFFMIFAMSAFMGAILAPVNASLMRSVAAHQRGEKELDISAAFRYLGRDLGAVLFGAAILGVLTVILLMACYLPVLLIWVFLSFASALIALHRRGALDGISMALSHARAHLSWHVQFGFAHLLLVMIASYVPVLGAMFALSFYVRTYRKVFGDGDEPVMDGVAQASG